MRRRDDREVRIRVLSLRKVRTRESLLMKDLLLTLRMVLVLVGLVGVVLLLRRRIRLRVVGKGTGVGKGLLTMLLLRRAHILTRRAGGVAVGVTGEERRLSGVIRRKGRSSRRVGGV